MASEGRAAAPAQAPTASSPPAFLVATASATTPPSPSSLQLLSLLHVRALTSASTPANCRSRVESNIVGALGVPYRRRCARGAVSIEVWAIFRSLLPLAISRPRRPHRPHRRVSSRAPRLSPRAGGRMAADAGATAGAAAGAAAARAALAAAAAQVLVRAATRGSCCVRACGGVFACDDAINYLRHRFRPGRADLEAFSRRVAAAYGEAYRRSDAAISSRFLRFCAL